MEITSFTSGLLVSVCAGASLAATALAQAPAKKQLTARELFYASAQMQPLAPPAAPKADTRKLTPKSTPRPNRTPARSDQIARADDKPRPNSPTQLDPGQGALAATPQTAPIPASGAPALGLRYTILKVAGGEVGPDTIFHAGDRIQLRVEANSPGYLYIVNQGSSGTWKPMFPSPEVENGNNHVESLRAYTLPSEEHRMVFDETAGSEKLFIILSTRPEPDLEKLIYSLQANPAVGQKPEDPAKSSRQMILASNLHIDDDTVGRMRSAYARDLIIEKVTPATPGEKKETAVYVVNPTGSSSSRVVADLTLVHQ
jgi:Domain of unknown function (DUF4384)